MPLRIIYSPLLSKWPILGEVNLLIQAFVENISFFEFKSGVIFAADPGGGGGGAPLYGLYGDVPLDMVWFLASLS